MKGKKKAVGDTYSIILLFALLMLFIFESFPFETLTGGLPHSSAWDLSSYPVFMETAKANRNKKDIQINFCTIRDYYYQLPFKFSHIGTKHFPASH